MTLNPITALLEPLEKLITEHGSAAIQEKHIALLREQLAILKEKLSVLATDKEKTDKENEKLKSQIQVLEIENKDLRQKVQEHEQSHSVLLDQPKVNILRLLFKKDNLIAEEIAQELKLEIQTTKFHLEELKTLNMIKSFLHRPITQKIYYSPCQETVIAWRLIQEGRRYLIEHKLIH